ncbi:hypothetical protein SAMN06297387_12357 [Streptomyces zhaozhouensis]|uniref:PIN domain-containing protein n=1 Tax=Streptomyces zhaozhouensis TaxID=1300267 RepID=A0A286E4I2_9ACTN|nr:DNA-binding protein [Streptomyces zhaozhouensis]SOD65803.1 hypothetical protein SAMN06297387_12357 [Streptomyces zhaozhouensis]
MNSRFETLVLDSQGLSAWIAQDREVLAVLRAFHGMGAEVVVGANTIVEVGHGRINLSRLSWVLSQARVEPVTARTARAAAQLLREAGLGGHRHAVDATVAEVACRQPGPVAMLTSDVGDMRRLCGDRVRLVRV